MTTGTKTVDSTFSLSTTCSSLTRIGRKTTKSWTGTDRPPVLRRGPKSSIVTVYREVKTPKGTFVNGFRFRPMQSRKPKRFERSVDGEHSYSCTITDSNQPEVRFLDKNPSVKTTYNGSIATCFSNLGYGSNPWTANDDIKLISNLKTELYGSDFDMSLFLGTGHQTVSLLLTTALRLADAMKAVKHGNIARAVDILGMKRKVALSRNARLVGGRSRSDVLSSAWLELQYGWKPLLQDIHAGAESLASHLNIPFARKFRARRRVLGAFPKNVNMSSVNRHSIARGQIIAYVSEKPTIAEMLGFQNPENLIWELLPFSFVADWIAPFGAYLEARGFASGLTGTFITTKTFDQFNGGPIVLSAGHPAYRSLSGSGEYLDRVYNLNRTVSTTLNVPMPRVKPLGKIASWAHLQNAVALIVQVGKY